MSIQWTNRDLGFLHHEYIREYDIKSANTSLMSYYNLMSQSDIDQIAEMPRDEREVTVGKLMRKSREFSEKLEKSFTDIIEEFIAANNLDREVDIISIKKDAVFIRNRSVKKTRFGDSVLFRPKGEYGGFIPIPGLEFYWKNGGGFDVKGISDELLPLHADGVLDLMESIFRESNKTLDLWRYMKEYASFYKTRQLPFAAYRQFDNSSKFLVHMLGQDVQMDMINESVLEYVDISYNYLNIYLECLKLILEK